MNFPNDANGNVLRRMQAAGDDLTRARNIDFTVVFPDGDVAERFANHFRGQGYTVSVEFAETDAEFPCGNRGQPESVSEIDSTEILY